MLESIRFIPIPVICSAIVIKRDDESSLYEITVYESPIGKIHGSLYAKSIYQPGLDLNIKPGTPVKVQVIMTYGGAEDRFIGVNNTSACYILGTFKEYTSTNIKVPNPLALDDNGTMRFIEPKSGAGISANEAGKTVISTGGPVYSIFNPFGFGNFENSHRTTAQNHQRVISHSPPEYRSREFFGLWAGDSIENKLTMLNVDDFLISYRRFVNQTRDVENWVSTCEGAYDPWVGPNNDLNKMDKGKETLFSKVVNHGSRRVSIELGSPGSEFINVRVDDVLDKERVIAAVNTTTPATLGNRFKMTVSDKGLIDIRANGEGVPGSNFNGLHLSVDSKGNLTIHAAGTITLSHGPNDESLNSIKMDPNKGIDIKAVNGFRVNDKPLLNENFLDWMVKNQQALCQVTAIGGPAPIHPLALPGFTNGSNAFDSVGGFLTKAVGAKATGIITDEDSFSSVA